MTTQVVTVEREGSTVTVDRDYADSSVVYVQEGSEIQIISVDQEPDTAIVSQQIATDVVTIQTGQIGERGPPGSSAATLGSSFVSQTQVQVLHNLHRKPVVQVLDAFGNAVITDIEHTSDDEFYVRFQAATSGSIVYF